MTQKFKTRPASAFSKDFADALENKKSIFLQDGKFEHSFEIDIDKIKPDPSQPRKTFDEESLENLARSLEKHGQLQPILVREGEADEWILVAGERRWRAATLAGWTTLLAIPFRGDVKTAALMENLQRQDLTPVEEARALRDLIELNRWTQREAAAELGLSQARISRSLQILTLPPTFLSDATKASVPLNTLVAIAREDDEEKQTRLMEQASRGELTVSRALNERKKNEPATVRSTQDDTEITEFFEKKLPSIQKDFASLLKRMPRLNKSQKLTLSKVQQKISELLQS